ncbi:MAG: methyltransferase, partial [Gammaproteobacteria bacterium]|nr:methyltransferase [Gammaproteobacteria bacterium]
MMHTQNTIRILLAGMVLALVACSGERSDEPAPAPAPEPQATPAPDIELHDERPDAAAKLAAALAAQPDDAQSRYPQRRPAETLSFFGIEPGMSVAEVFPGGGWYSKILLPYLGEDGRLIGVDYPIELFSLFGFMSEEQLQA